MTSRAASRRTGRIPLLGSLAVVVIVGAGGVAGCQKVLFDKNAPRTQFETHDRLRQRYIPLEEEDVFGNPQPALRARLAPSG